MGFIFFYFILTLLSINIISYIFQPEFAGMFFKILSSGKTWIIAILGSFIALIPDFLYVCVSGIFFPSDSEKILKCWKKNKGSARYSN